jgi:hypothetical protein
MPCPRVPPSLIALAREVLQPTTSVELATLAAGDHGPCLVVLVVDELGLLVAVREVDLVPADIGETCATLLDLAAFEPCGAAVVVSVDPGFGTDPPDSAERTWHELRPCFAEHGLELLDWLLVAGTEVVSVPRWFGEPSAW